VTTGPLPASHLGYERARRHPTPPRKVQRTHSPWPRPRRQCLLVTSDLRGLGTAGAGQEPGKPTASRLLARCSHHRPVRD